MLECFEDIPTVRFVDTCAACSLRGGAIGKLNFRYSVISRLSSSVVQGQNQLCEMPEISLVGAMFPLKEEV